MMNNCKKCKYADVLSSQEPCNKCKHTPNRKYFKPKEKQELKCKWGIDNIVYTNNGGYAKPTITFDAVGYIENYSGGMSPDDIRKELESRLNGRDDRVDAYSDAIKSYCEHDVKVNSLMRNSFYGMYGQYGPKTVIKKVIFNDPATIVMWTDGTKTVVKAVDEEFDPEKGLAMAITKKALGNKGNYFDEIKKWTEPYYEKEAKEEAEKKPEFSLLDFLINPEKGFTMTFEADGKEITLNDVVMAKKGTE